MQLSTLNLSMTRPGIVPFSVASLFANNEQGVWYDPSDLTTLFQDAAGTTPVTAVEQPVGLMLDKSKNGVGTNGAKRVNLLTYSQDFTNVAWTKGNSTITANTDVAPNGTLTGNTLDFTTGINYHNIYYGFFTGTTATATHSIYLKYNTQRYVAVIFGDNAGNLYGCIVDLTTGTIAGAGNGGAGVYTSSSIVAINNGWYRISITGNTLNNSNAVYLAARDSSVWGGNAFISSTGGGSVYIWGAQLEAGSTVSTYQKITSDWPSTEAGNHAYQTTSANRPTLSARYNLLTKTEQFDDAVWSKVRGTITATTETSPIGTATADVLTQTTGQTTAALIYINNTVPSAPASTSFVFSMYAKKGGKNFLVIGTDATGAAGNNLYSYFNISNGTLGTAASGHTLGISDAGGGWYRCTLTATTRASVQNLNYYIGHADTNNSLTVTDSGSTSIWGADLRVANDGVGIPAYQRVNTATDYDTVGFPKYLSFNGSSSAMVTNTVTPGTDKAQVFAGVRKLSDAGAGDADFIVEFSASMNANNGSFALTGRDSYTPANYEFISKGTSYAVAGNNNSEYVAPVTNVITGVGEISTDTTILRVNGTQVASSATDQGTGNYLAYPLYIGARAGIVLWFNGRIYSMIVRFGSNLTTDQITNTEKYVNSKTKAY